MGKMTDGSKCDLVVKDLFERDHPSLPDQLTAGVAVREVPNVELARVEERRADLVLLLADVTSRQCAKRVDPAEFARAAGVRSAAAVLPSSALPTRVPLLQLRIMQGVLARGATEES